MKGVDRFTVHATREVIGSQLWSFGEDELADRVLTSSDDEHEAILRISAVYESADYPLPVEGVRISHGHVDALATIAFFEGALRPLARNRRRRQKDMPARFGSSSDAG